MIFFTSDLHIGHANIIKYCNRPFSSVDEMNNGLIKNFNEILTSQDVVYHLGDFSLNKKNISIINKFNGEHHLIVGNHDDCYPWRAFNPNKVARYIAAGFKTVQKSLELDIDGLGLCLLEHFPYAGDSQENDRYSINRPARDIKHKYLLCGHVHNVFKMRENVINVGVDVWDYKPVSIDQLKQLINLGK